MTRTSIKKVVLAYSGGLDTSVILKWLQEVLNDRFSRRILRGPGTGGGPQGRLKRKPAVLRRDECLRGRSS